MEQSHSVRVCLCVVYTADQQSWCPNVHRDVDHNKQIYTLLHTNLNQNYYAKLLKDFSA